MLISKNIPIIIKKLPNNYLRLSFQVLMTITYVIVMLRVTNKRVNIT